ncbi:hypothetical protein M422DRAFT_253152 [Sphaerobolus stellatus SS14]|uniref:Uncharacterized protein n=1 Tax=Sphaerobolus stellatus (strain SS14) TaxID=990650 RepID=A0A0C9VXH5_SPHS4|nr:hypothetical protein M422DRAFT_253152 [Sphaerobolus stellatus SS14]
MYIEAKSFNPNFPFLSSTFAVTLVMLQKLTFESACNNIPTPDGEDNDEGSTISQSFLRRYLRTYPSGGPFVHTSKRVYADPPTSITGVLPKPLGKFRAEQWDQSALRGASEWILDHSVQDTEMRCLYREGKLLQSHECTPDHNATIFHINNHVRSLPDLTTSLLVCDNDPNWMADIVCNFDKNPSGVPQHLHTEGVFVNVDDINIWYWVNLMKPKFHGAEAGNVLQLIFSTPGRWSQLVAGHWKKKDSNTGNEPMDQDIHPPDQDQDQHDAGPSSLADYIDYSGEEFSKPPVDVANLCSHTS